MIYRSSLLLRAVASACDDFLRDLCGGLFNVSVQVFAGDHELGGDSGGMALNNHRRCARGFAAAGGRLHFVELRGGALREVGDVHQHLQVGLALAKADDGALQLIAFPLHRCENCGKLRPA